MNKKLLLLNVFVLLLFLNIVHSEIVIRKYDFSQEQKKIINLNQRNLIAIPINISKSITPCEKASFSVLIYNNGTYREDYRLEFEDFIGKAYINPLVRINPKQSKLIKFDLEPDCSVYGKIIPKLKIITEKSNLFAEIPIFFDIKREYNFTIELNQNIKVCEQETNEVPVKITNQAKFANEYEIYFEKETPGIKLSENKIMLNPSEVKNINLKIDTKENNQKNSYILIAESNLGDLIVKKRINVTIDDCYDYDFYTIQGKICSDQESINIGIANKGKYEAEFELSLLDFNEIFDLSESQLSIPPNGSKESSLLIKSESSGLYNLKLQSSIAGKSISNEHSFDLEVISFYNCQRPEITTKEVWTKHGENYRYLEIENKGIRSGKYKLTKKNYPWIEIQENFIELGPGETQKILLGTYAGENVNWGFYPVEFLIEEVNTEQFYGYTVNFVVFDYSIPEFLIEFRCMIILFVILLLIIILFFILLLRIRKGKSKRATVLIIIFLLILGLIILLFCFPFMKGFYGWQSYKINQTVNKCESYLNDSVCNSTLYHSWNEDSEYLIFLDKYFYDPENETLNFSAAKTEHIDITIQGNDTRLTPEPDWYGIETVYFIAEDPHGAEAYSPEFYLHVLNTKEFSLFDYTLDNYQGVFTAMIIVLVIASIIIFFLKSEEEKETIEEE
ncbi:hypothetical protein GF327_05645 [Candidatus Woesearchaeota archaeon]|nr:hypothetical protein [Candidatus Woesearchaeota archaeon]